ncbi:MAG TPA: hypothetical protein VEI02_08395 [Planctomycetota bacterium]|nr:hypothetical protein [Planctomycetota bacterium]
MKMCARVVLSVVATATSAAAQCPGFIPPSFLNSTSATGNELNILTPADSTANSLVTPSAQDNLASASIGDGVVFTLSNVQGAVGAPVTIAFTPGNPAPAGVFPFGNLHLDLSQPMGFLVDGIGLGTGVPNPFLGHPGPNQLWTMGVGLAAIPGLGHTCWTLQAALADPTQPFGVGLSNAALFNIRGGVVNVQPNFGPENSSTVVSALGAASGTSHFTAYNPAGNAAIPPTFASTSPNLTFTVPLGSGSGPVAFEYPTAPGLLTALDPDNTATWFAVTDPAGIFPGSGAGALNLTTSAFNANEKFASVIGNVPNATTTHLYSLALNIGDVVTVEAYSLNLSQSRIIDGYGKTFNAAAFEGNDFILNLRESTNTMPLVFDQGAVGPFQLTGDDDSGPGFNPRLTFQVRATDNYQIALGTSPLNAGAYASGDYLLNVRVLSTAPAVASFRTPGLNPTQINARGAGLTVEVLGANFPTTNTVSVRMTPLHGLYAPFVVSGVTPTSSTALTFTIPALAPPNFCVGSHYVQIVNDATGETSFIWDDTFFATLGIIPELLVVRTQTVAAMPAATGGLPGLLTANTQTFGAQMTSTTTPLQNPFFQRVGATGLQTIYMEALGTKWSAVGTAQHHGLVDTFIETGGTQGVFNPLIWLYGPTGLGSITNNDDDGSTPFLYNWPHNFSPGIGFNAAILQPMAGFAGAGTTNFIVTIQETFLITAPSQRGFIVNVVVL